MLTPEKIIELISIGKIIQEKPKPKEKNRWSHQELWFIAFSQDHQYIFEVFMRQNAHLPERFSIGISWKTDEWSVWLFRYNGTHAPHRNRLTWEEVTWPHIHSYNTEYINAGLEYDAYAQETDLYISYEEAQLQFFKAMNVINYADYFPNIETMNNNLFTA